jgi:hypothetical protein
MMQLLILMVRRAGVGVAAVWALLLRRSKGLRRGPIGVAACMRALRGVRGAEAHTEKSDRASERASERERERDSQTERESDRETDRQAERATERQRETETETDREREARETGEGKGEREHAE